MPIPCYLALTEREFSHIPSIPENCAWMACHFSGYSTGLSNLPRQLPPGSMVIVNDLIPVCGHDPERILAQLLMLLEQVQPVGFLLDLQRPGEAQTRQIAKVLTEGLPCPVGVTPEYAKSLDCPVFLEPPPLYVSLETHIAPWRGREIWLEATFGFQRLTVTEAGCQIETVEEHTLQESALFDEALCCSYHVHKDGQSATFTLRRKREELEKLLLQAEALGITRAVGLYQQLGSM